MNAAGPPARSPACWLPLAPLAVGLGVATAIFEGLAELVAFLHDSAERQPVSTNPLLTARLLESPPPLVGCPRPGVSTARSSR